MQQNTYTHAGAGLAVCLLATLGSVYAVSAQAGDPAPRGQEKPGEPLSWTTQQDHRNMMDQLGITRLRPGPSGNLTATNAANYDPAKANPFPELPDILTLKNGQRVTTAGAWWDQRRAEIVEDFEREVVGRVPRNAPKVTWTVVSNEVLGWVGNVRGIGKRLVGHVDNSACPSIDVDIRMTVVTPANDGNPVPVLMMFGGFGGDGMPRPPGTEVPTNRFPEFGGPFKDPPSTEQLLAAGWGYAILNPGSIQADNGAGLTKGIIGLVNKGQPRKPDDWGTLRAWAWGAARGLDYLETDPLVQSTKVGIEGVSRFGKAALVTMAFEPRFAMALVGSSGEGGAKLHRRNFGEAVENLTGSGEYHWMAGNFLKYGAAESAFGSRNAGDLPVDAHMLIALCAPRLTFISYGIPERGDARWLDQQGSYTATVAAGPVFRLLGARDLGDVGDYRAAMMPPVNTGLLDGALAWRQHDGGHEDRSNMKHFIAWTRLGLPGARLSQAASPATAQLQAFVDRHELAGAVALVADKVKVLSVDTVGYADIAAGRAMKPDALFWIASESKAMTATAVMMLVDEGKIALDDPVEKYLPEFRGQKVVVEQDAEHSLLRKPAHPITLREVLSHMSGMPFQSALETPTLDGLPLGTAVRSYAMTPLQAEPGTHYQYSNAGINTAARILEVVSGTRYEDFMRRRLFEPLGMKDTTFWPSEDQALRIAKAYRPDASKSNLVETVIGQLIYPLTDRAGRHPMPAGGLFSSATDTARFCQMLLNRGELEGRRYLSEAAFEELVKRQTPMSVKESYGLGLAVWGDGFGHGGAFATQMDVQFVAGLAIIWMVQHEGFPGGGAKAKEVFKTWAMEHYLTGNP